MVVEFCGFLLCVCVLLGSLIGNGGLGSGFALCVFFAWQVCSMCVCVLLGGFASGSDELRKRETKERERGRIKNNRERIIK